MNPDAKLRFHMSAELIILNNRLKTTIVYVTHDQMEAKWIFLIPRTPSHGDGLIIDAGCFRVPVPVIGQSAYQAVMWGRMSSLEYNRSGSEVGKDAEDFAPIDGHGEVVEPLGSGNSTRC